jgi:hypothetical protein
MASNEKKLLKTKFRLIHVILFPICFSISFCFAAPNTLPQDIKSTSAVNVEPIDGKTESPKDMNLNKGNLTVDQMQNNPPTASRPRFPIPKPNPEPTPELTPTPTEKGVQ